MPVREAWTASPCTAARRPYARRIGPAQLALLDEASACPHSRCEVVVGSFGWCGACLLRPMTSEVGLGTVRRKLPSHDHVVECFDDGTDE